MKTDGFRSIVLATDGSQESDSAMRVAASLALASSASVHVVHVWNMEVHHRHGIWDVETRNEAGELIAQAVKSVRGQGVEADAELDRADGTHVAAAIAQAARRFSADLVVVGSRGLSDWEAMFQQSVSRELLSAVDCPVLIVRANEQLAVHRPQRIVAAVAGGPDVEPAIRAAAAAAAAPGSRVLVLHVVVSVFGAQSAAFVETDREIKLTVDTATALLDDAGIVWESRVIDRTPIASAIAEVATEWGADVIVTGPSRIGNLASLLFGSVTHGLLRGTNVPVLVAERASR